MKSSEKEERRDEFRCAASKARKHVYSVHIRFLTKLINERQTADSLPLHNKEESQIKTVEQIKDDINNSSQVNPFPVYLVDNIFFYSTHKRHLSYCNS